MSLYTDNIAICHFILTIYRHIIMYLQDTDILLCTHKIPTCHHTLTRYRYVVIYSQDTYISYILTIYRRSVPGWALW